jgi:hypothetical protein
MLILDDSDRGHYQHAVQRLRAWVRKDFCGIKPFQSKLGSTTCWTKPEARTEPELVRAAAGFTGVAGADRQEITHSNPERSVPRGSRPGPGQNS